MSLREAFGNYRAERREHLRTVLRRYLCAVIGNILEPDTVGMWWGRQGNLIS